MDSLLNINEAICLIDIFRLTVSSNEKNRIESLTSINEHNENDNKNVDSKPRTFKINCLDLSSKLLDGKIVEPGATQPWDNLQQIVFERLMIEDYSSCKQISIDIPANEKLICSPNFAIYSLGNEFNPGDSQIMRYLYGCYYRLQQLIFSVKTKENKSSNDDVILTKLNKTESVLLDQVILYLTEPELFPDRTKRSKNNQQAPLLLNLVSHYISKRDASHIDLVQKFVNSLGEISNTQGSACYDAIIGPTYARLSQKFLSMAIDDPTLPEWLQVTKVFIQQPDIASKFLERNTLKKDSSLAYQSTLLGFMLSISPLPRNGHIETTFFNDPIRLGERDHKFTETQLGLKLKIISRELYTIFHCLLKLPQTRNSFLFWLGRCLHTFKDRKKLWSNQVLMSTTTLSVNDGFLMNFLAVMLHLSEPFAGPYNLESMSNIDPSQYKVDKRILKVDPKYCKWSKVNHEESLTHFLGLSEETFLISADKSAASNSSVQKDNETNTYQPNFISECFFGTHVAFTYGFRSLYERFSKLSQNITELQHAYADAMAQPMQSQMSSQDPREILKERISSSMTQFLNLRAVLNVPNRCAMQLHFCIATAAYLNHLVACSSFEEAAEAKEFKTVTLDMLRDKKVNRVCLEFIPEMLIENVLDYFIFLKHFNEQSLTQATNRLEPLMTMIITFMGNSMLMQNPHLRARFAEILECMMPHQSYQTRAMVGCPEIFENHPLITQLTPSLVSVFVGIEMTGEGVQFEQKFSYRRPMYVVLEYLWDRPLHRKILIDMAQEAEQNIDSSRPPLFLRFINLLMNDAIFLLDEALGYMNQLKEAERRRKTEEWQKLTPQQRMQAEAGYTHVGRLARFHNVLSLSTIGTIAWITSEIQTIFCHPTLVDRIANMLNYFLEHLVGPKKGKFNVNDKNDYEFKPREVLEKICKIYIHLGRAEVNKKYREFCTAVSSDGRSYSENLLPQASDILFRTGMSSLGAEFENLSALVREVALKNQMDEIASEDIPDTFLDPIMSTLMVDPVLLPSSRIIVDRSTIARHLLSDQTDPFNRSPLSMEDVIPESDLKVQIDTFLKERRAAKHSARQEQSQ